MADEDKSSKQKNAPMLDYLRNRIIAAFPKGGTKLEKALITEEVV